MRAVVLCILGLAACTPTVNQVPGITESSAAQVADCTLLGTVRGVPGVFGPLKDIGLAEARRAAKKKALEVGGDTIVFDPIPAGDEVYELPAQVYNCA